MSSRTCLDGTQLAAVIFSSIFGTLILCLLSAALIWWYVFGGSGGGDERRDEEGEAQGAHQHRTANGGVGKRVYQLKLSSRLSRLVSRFTANCAKNRKPGMMDLNNNSKCQGIPQSQPQQLQPVKQLGQHNACHINGMNSKNEHLPPPPSFENGAVNGSTNLGYMGPKVMGEDETDIENHTKIEHNHLQQRTSQGISCDSAVSSPTITAAMDEEAEERRRQALAAVLSPEQCQHLEENRKRLAQDRQELQQMGVMI